MYIYIYAYIYIYIYIYMYIKNTHIYLKNMNMYIKITHVCNEYTYVYKETGKNLRSKTVLNNSCRKQISAKKEKKNISLLTLMLKNAPIHVHTPMHRQTCIHTHKYTFTVDFIKGEHVRTATFVPYMGSVFLKWIFIKRTKYQISLISFWHDWFYWVAIPCQW